MTDLEIKIYFYKNKIENIINKINILKKRIILAKQQILQFIKTIDDKNLQEILLKKINMKSNIIDTEDNSAKESICKEYYNVIKNKYRTLKYAKNVLKENIFLFWCDTLNNEDKLNYILFL